MNTRPADPQRDGAACAAIYAPFVEGSATSFEEAAPDATAFAARIERLRSTHAYLVAEDQHGVAGFAYGSPHRDRPAYRWACEVSIYLHERTRGRGIGRALYEDLFARLAERGFRVVLAGITLPNPASVALHEACGFEPVGIYLGIGWKAGNWQDVGWWQKRLGAASGPPTELS